MSDDEELAAMLAELQRLSVRFVELLEQVTDADLADLYLTTLLDLGTAMTTAPHMRPIINQMLDEMKAEYIRRERARGEIISEDY